jgi:hypothetical protein
MPKPQDTVRRSPRDHGEGFRLGEDTRAALGYGMEYTGPRSGLGVIYDHDFAVHPRQRRVTQQVAVRASPITARQSRCASAMLQPSCAPR